MSASLLIDILEYENISSFLENIPNYFLFEVFAKIFLLYDEKLAHKVKSIYLYKEIPNDIVKKLDLSLTDKGIDLLIETFDDTYIGVQCKYSKNIDKKIPWGKLSTFEAIISRNNNFEAGILFSNMLEPCNEIKKNNKIIFCMNQHITESKTFIPFLKREIFKNIESLTTNNKKEEINVIPKKEKVKIINNKKEFNMITKKEKTKIIKTNKTIVINTVQEIDEVIETNESIVIDKEGSNFDIDKVNLDPTIKKLFLNFTKRQQYQDNSKFFNDLISDFYNQDIFNLIMAQTLKNKKRVNDKIFEIKNKIFISKLKRNSKGEWQIANFVNYIFEATNGKQFVAVKILRELYKEWCVTNNSDGLNISKIRFTKIVLKMKTDYIYPKKDLYFNDKCITTQGGRINSINIDNLSN
jgi:hypothetical protein